MFPSIYLCAALKMHSVCVMSFTALFRLLISVNIAVGACAVLYANVEVDAA